MNGKHTLETLGLRVNNQSHDFSALRGKKCFGKMLDNPDFTTVEGFTQLEDRIPDAVRVTPQQDGIDFGNREHIVVDGHYVHTVTPRYNLYQNKELLMNVRDAIQQIGLQPVGNLRHERGKMTGHVVFVGAEEQINLLEDTGEDIMTGVKFSNSYDGSRGVGVESFGIRTICLNYNLWGETLNYVKVGHGNKSLVEQIEDAFQTTIKHAQKLPAVINRAKDVIINQEDVRDLFYGVGFPEAYVERNKVNVVDNLHRWEPETKDNLNVWTAYNAGTALLTHGANMNPDGVEYYSKRLGQLLSTPVDEILDRGQERREKIEARIAEKAKA